MRGLVFGRLEAEDGSRSRSPGETARVLSPLPYAENGAGQTISEKYLIYFPGRVSAVAGKIHSSAVISMSYEIRPRFGVSGGGYSRIFSLAV